MGRIVSSFEDSSVRIWWIVAVFLMMIVVNGSPATSGPSSSKPSTSKASSKASTSGSKSSTGSKSSAGSQSSIGSQSSTGSESSTGSDSSNGSDSTASGSQDSTTPITVPPSGSSNPTSPGPSPAPGGNTTTPPNGNQTANGTTGSSSSSAAVFDINDGNCGNYYHNMDGLVVCYQRQIVNNLTKNHDKYQVDAAVVYKKCINAALVHASTLPYTIHNQDFKNLVDECVKRHGYEGGIGDIPSEVDLPGANGSWDSGSHQTVCDHKATIFSLVTFNILVFWTD